MNEKTRQKMIADELMRFGRQAKQGITLGFADEIEDALGAGMAAALTDMSYKDAMKMAREISQSQLSKDWEESPITSFAGQAVGGLPLGFTRAGQAAANWVRSGSKAAGVGKGAALGAGLGAASGVGSAGDSIGERATGGAVGASIGGITGGVTAPLARLGIGSDEVDFRKVTDKTSKAFENKAQKELARQLSARPDLKEQLARAESMSAASQRSGIPLTLAEMVAQSSSDPLLAQQAVISSNPMTAGRMGQMYASRSGTPQQAGAIENRLMALAQQLDPSVGSYDEATGAVIGRAGEASGDITRQLTAQARPLYEKAYSSALPDDSEILQNPLIQSSLQRIRNNPVFAQEIGGLPDNSIQALDAVKRSLDDMAEAAGRQGNRNEARLIQNARTELLSAMDSASPEYAQARQVYSGNPDALQMRERIGSLADVDPMNSRKLGQQLFSGTQQNAELAAQALGNRAPTAAAARIYGAMDELRNDPVNIASRIAPDKRTSEMLRTYAGSGYEPLEETLGVINQAKLGERMRYGSPTQPRMQAEQGLSEAAGNALNAAVDVKTGGTSAIVRKVANMFGRGSQDADPQFYADMADLMLTDKGMDLLRRVSTGQQQAIQELQTVGLPSLITGESARLSISSPVSNALISGFATPEQKQSPVFIEQKQQNSGLPPGFVLQQPNNDLPPGFVLQGVR
jgi:hypothetical protein